MLKIETADLLRLAVLKQSKVLRFKVWHRLALAIGGHNVDYHQTRVRTQCLVGVHHVLRLVRAVGLGIRSQKTKGKKGQSACTRRCSPRHRLTSPLRLLRTAPVLAFYPVYP